MLMDVGQKLTNVGRNYNGRWMKLWWMLDECVSDDIAMWSTFVSSAIMACKREKRNVFFLLLRVIIIIIIIIIFFFFLFFFQRCYKGYSLHDYKLKNTHECTTQMLTSKPMYNESKCMWGCIIWCRSCTAIKPCVCVCACSQDLKLAIKQALELFAPSSLRSSET
jgi:hypothetical protein